jgi:hypothetical protein
VLWTARLKFVGFVPSFLLSIIGVFEGVKGGSSWIRFKYFLGSFLHFLFTPVNSFSSLGSYLLFL